MAYMDPMGFHGKNLCNMDDLGKIKKQIQKVNGLVGKSARESIDFGVDHGVFRCQYKLDGKSNGVRRKN